MSAGEEGSVLAHIGPQFVAVPNETARDHALTTDALAILTRMRSHVEGWHFTVTLIARDWDISEKRVKAALALLRDLGYVHFSREIGGRGRVASGYAIAAVPVRDCEQAMCVDCRKRRTQVDGLGRSVLTPPKTTSHIEDHQVEDHQDLSQDQSQNLSLKTADSGLLFGDELPPSTRGKRPPDPGRKGDSPQFDEFWAAYPRKAGKAAARRMWERVMKDHLLTPAEVIDGARRYAAEREGQDQQFTAHASTWLNAGRWADEPSDPDIAAEGLPPWEQPDDTTGYLPCPECTRRHSPQALCPTKLGLGL